MAKAPVRLDDVDDSRFELMGDIAGFNRFESLGRMARLYAHCTTEQEHVVTESRARSFLTDKGVLGAVEAELLERVDGGLRVRGTEGRIEWYAEYKAGRRKGGLNRSAGAKRVGGAFTTLSEPTKQPADDQLTTSCKPAEHQLSTSCDQVSGSGSGSDQRKKETREATQPTEVPPDLGTRRKAERQLIERLHAERYNATSSSLRSDVRPLNLAGDGERWLADCLLTRGANLDAAVADCHRAMENREKQAIRIKSVRFFGPRMWSSDEFTSAIGWTDADIAKMGAKAIAAELARAPEFRKLT